jgi:glycerol-3-phosphate acyltransferase PlsX
MVTPDSISLPIAIDVMGADLGPFEIIEGCLLALKELPDLPGLMLVGDQEIIKPFLENKKKDAPLHQISFCQASEIIGMDEKPLSSIRHKKDSSMVRALELVQSGRASAMLSCGNTGSLMAGGMLKIRPMVGIERPALATVIPTRGGHFILIDSGANPTPEPQHLVQNALLGYHYASAVLQLPRPRVGLLTIGTEEGKGTDLILQTHEQLKNIQDLVGYTGLIEGFHLFESVVDVVVCDGFVGNILLKTCESLFASLKGFLKEELSQNWMRKTGAFLSQGVYRTMKEKFSPEQYGGAPLLGLKQPILKGHGSSNRHSVLGAIRIAHQIVKYDMNDHVQDTLQKVHERAIVN